MNKGFFEVKSVAECRDILASFEPVADTEDISSDQALDRVAAGDILAGEDIPGFNRSSMDGFALRAGDSFGAGEGTPVYLELKARMAVDEAPQWTLGPRECAQVLTGGSLPPGADAVVMWEHVREIAEDEVEIFRAVSPGENVMLQGEDCQWNQTVVPDGTRLRPQELGVLSALGILRTTVRRRPRVAILSTGDELVPVQETPPAGKIRDVNSSTLAAWCVKAGCIPEPMGIIPDRLDDLHQGVSAAVQKADCVLLSGGSSLGARDLSIEVISGLDQGRVLVHGVAMSPGKPTILAAAGRVPIIGLPGQVTSAQVVMYVLGLPFLAHLSGVSGALEQKAQARLRARAGRNIPSQQGREDYVRVRLLRSDHERLLAEPVLAKSGLLRSLLRADGLLPIPASCEGVRAGEECEVLLL
ncbi:gephyrin-like molybdotransferase Glp [Desulfovermiculus halophilus]|uniref:molybdopterin molybdotransferase MoeA n=1 Tax=Desulfovermiculus halophilus TaxID=339722 RepID=UPI000481EB57|nr:gephyrin-like molybdotransferase Glp [Desulfovermiculus halophilus]